MEDRNDYNQTQNNNSFNEINLNDDYSNNQTQQKVQPEGQTSKDPYANLSYNEALDMVINNFKNNKKGKYKKEEKTSQISQENANQKTQKKNPFKVFFVIFIMLAVGVALALCVYFFVFKDEEDGQTNDYNIYSNDISLGSASGQLSENGEELTLTASPNGQSIFIGWAQDSESGDIVSEETVITVEYNESDSYYAIFNISTKTHSYRNIEYTLYVEAEYAVVTGISDANLREITLPDVVNYEGTNFKVYKIEQNAFSGTGLTRVNITNNLYRIEAYAFYNCTELSIVSFGDGSNLSFIDEYAFANCTSLERINLPANVTTSSTAFENCPLLAGE